MVLVYYLYNIYINTPVLYTNVGILCYIYIPQPRIILRTTVYVMCSTYLPKFLAGCRWRRDDFVT